MQMAKVGCAGADARPPHFDVVSSRPARTGIARITYLIVGERAVLVDGIDLGDFRSNWLAFEHRFLFALGEQRNLVVDVLQHDVNGRLGRQLLGAVVLREGGGMNE